MKNIRKNYNNIDELIIDMQSKENKFKKIFKVIQVVFFLFIFIYAAIFLTSRNGAYIMAGGCYIIAFILFIIYAHKYLKKYEAINYSEPIKKVLEEAELRYRKYNFDILIVLAGVLFINAATLLVLISKFSDRYTSLNIVIVVEIVFFIIIVIAWFLGVLTWEKDNKPIWLSIKKVLKELEE